MGKRLGKALQALGLVLLITVACLAFMPWNMSDVIDGIEDVNRCMILRYDTQYSTAYPRDEVLEELKTELSQATGQFDRRRAEISYKGDAPLYHIYFWTAEGRIGDVLICGDAIYHNGSQYVFGETSEKGVNRALERCFPNK